jgi:signal transduction histidine kinase
MNVTRPSWPVLLPVFFVLVIVSFGAATIFSQSRAAAIDRHALVVAEKAAPAIVRMSEARRLALNLAILTRQQFDLRSGSVGPDPSTLAQIREVRDALDRSVEQSRLAAASDPQSMLLVDRIVTTKAGLRASLDRIDAEFANVDVDTADARTRLDEELRASVLALNEALLQSVDYNADLAQQEANEIRRLRSSSNHLARGLDLASAALAMAAAVVLWGTMRTHAVLLTRLRRLSDERATELDAFAGRVAHDIRGPLGVIALVLDMVGRSSEGTPSAPAIERGRRAVARVTRLVDGLLGFARGGAQQDGHARAEVGEAVADVVDQLQGAAEKAGVELLVDVRPGLAVRCATGVLTSIISNLAGNAIKYMQDAPKRRVIIRAALEGSFVRLEVEDTGPGIPAGFESKIFAPFVRATKGSEEGVGLGLATVRRFAEACGGSAGVRPNAGGPGSTFWVRLRAAAPATRPSTRRRVLAPAAR